MTCLPSFLLHQMVTDTIAKVREVKKASDKSVILVGWGVAAAINCQVRLHLPYVEPGFHILIII